MSKKIKQLLPIIFLLTIAITAFGQESNQLKEKRNKQKEEIEKTATEIQLTEKKRKSTYQRYLDLKKTAGSKQELIKTLTVKIEQIEKRVTRQEEVVNSLAADLQLMQQSYGELLRKSYRQSHSNQQFLFLASAMNFNDFIQRWRFLKQYHSYKKRQVTLIQNTKKALETQNKTLTALQIEKRDVIQHAKVESKKLGVAIQEKEKIVKDLSKKEKALKIRLEKQEKAKNQLNASIEKAIYAEIKTERAKNRTSRGIKSSKKPTKNEQGITRNFRAKKGKLPMPVKGKIVGKFGIRVHRESNNTKTESPGVDIETTANSSVKVVYNGKIVRSFFKPEFQNIVLVQHGEYFTLYSNLKSVVVKKGAIVKAGDVIGKVGTKNGKTELHFQIWQNGTKLNPEDWL